MKPNTVIGRIQADEKPGANGRLHSGTVVDKNSSWKLQSAELPASKMPAWGWKHPHNLRGPLRAEDPGQGRHRRNRGDPQELHSVVDADRTVVQAGLF